MSSFGPKSRASAHEPCGLRAALATTLSTKTYAGRTVAELIAAEGDQARRYLQLLAQRMTGPEGDAGAIVLEHLEEKPA